MKNAELFIGDIRKCTKYDKWNLQNGVSLSSDIQTDIYKRNAVLIKVGNYYIDSDIVKNDLSLILSYITKKNLLDTIYNSENQLYVDKKTIKPYQVRKNIKVKQLKKI